MTIPSNEDRAKSVAAAIQAFAKAQGLSEKDDGPEVIAGDIDRQHLALGSRSSPRWHTCSLRCGLSGAEPLHI